MLRRLTVENFALIDTLSCEWDSNLNIITGETGAGKSVLLGAIQLLLGARNDSSSIKDTSRNCVIEAEFTVDEAELGEFFREEDIDPDSTLIIRRTISPSGKSRTFVNDCPVQVSALKNLSSHLIDIHSQHENLILSSEKFRTHSLDIMARTTAEAVRHAELYREILALKRQAELIAERNRRYADQTDWLRHELTELEEAHLRDGETEELEAELKILENSDAIRESLCSVSSTLSTEETGVVTLLKQNIASLERIGQAFGPAAEYASRLRSVEIELKDIAQSTDEDAGRVESDPERTEKVSSRLSTIYTLCNKHKVSDEQALIRIRDEYAARLSAVEGNDGELEQIRNQIGEREKERKSVASLLHDSRSKASSEFSARVVDVMHRVGMADAAFSIELRRTEPQESGEDCTVFLFSSTPKAAPQPIEKIASGGEMSRVMLGVKSTLAERMSLPTIIFDEIDTGVSGTVANSVGEVIASMAAHMQVIAITHLPQVASKGTSHVLVYKDDGQTRLRRLTEGEREEEIAKMLSSDDITDAAREQARNLLKA